VRSRIVCSLVIVAAMLGGCGKSGTVSPDWDPSAARVTAGLARQLAREVRGSCIDYALLERVTYVDNSTRIHAPIASAAGSCTVLTETVEISAFADAKHRDQFVADRGRIICQRAAKAKAALPGLHWVVGGNWSLQPDTEGLGRRLAAAFKARYVLTPCSDNIVDWSDTDVTHVDKLAAGLQKAGLGCADFSLQNRENLVQIAHYVETGLPGAYGTCTIGADSNVLIGSFDDTLTLLAPFVQREQQYLCAQSKTTRFVIGSDWLVAVSRGEDVAGIATALRGRAFGDTCPTPTG
jgi:hypothetical protein